MAGDQRRRGARAAACGLGLAVAAVVAFAAAGCTASGSSSSSNSSGAEATEGTEGAATTAGTGAQGPSGARSAAPADAPADLPTLSSPADACVTQVYGTLTLAQRVGQLFLVGVDGDQAGPELTAAEATYHFGSLLLNQTAVGTVALAASTVAMQALAPAATGGVKFFIATNQEGGEVQHLTGPGFTTMPSEVDQGTWPTSTLRAEAAQWGTELRAAGVNLDLAPVLDVVPPGTAAGNAAIGALDRDYGGDPASDGAHGVAFIDGMADAGVTTVAKHFPGLGRATGNTDFASDVVDTVTTAADPYLNSFRAAIAAGVPMMMVALATYTRIDPTRLAAFSPVVMRLLRAGLGFSGVIVSDDLGAAQAVQSIPAGLRAIDFISAGGDLITSQNLGPAETMAAAVLTKASAEPAFRALVDEAAKRVLAAKRAAGLLPC